MATYLRNIPIEELSTLIIKAVHKGSKLAKQCGQNGAVTLLTDTDTYVLYNRQGELLLGKILNRDDKDRINKR